MTTNGPKTRDQILDAALKRFAHHGFNGTSVQEIVDDARVSKPALYYYFTDKSSLYQALVDKAHDERYRLMQETASRGGDLRTRLVKVLTVQFAFLQDNRALMRLTMATAFAAPGELPEGVSCLERDKPKAR
jgi:TetR/AcrR family transcriptional repressor of mexJK operon